MTDNKDSKLTIWTSRSSNEKIKQYGNREEPGFSEVVLYFKEHNIKKSSVFDKTSDGSTTVDTIELTGSFASLEEFVRVFLSGDAERRIYELQRPAA
jgi:hypothetical protein